MAKPAAVALLAVLAFAAGCAGSQESPSELRLAHDVPAPPVPPPTRDPTMRPLPEPTSEGPPPSATPSSAPPDRPPLDVAAGGPYVGQALVWVAVAAITDGDANCAWSGNVTFEAPGACRTRVMAVAPGTHGLTVLATLGSASAMATATFEAVFPQPDGTVTGELYAYNAAAGQTAGVSNILALATGDPAYPRGTDVVLAARGILEDHVEPGTTAHAFILDGNGTVVGGPLALNGTDEAAGTPPGEGTAFRSTPWTIPEAAPAGPHWLAVRVEVDGSHAWVQDASGGHKMLEFL